MKKKVALIAGVTIEDGAYLDEYLLKKDHAVHGMKRKSSPFFTDRIDYLYQEPLIENRDFFLHYEDITDSTKITRFKKVIKPDGTVRKLTDVSKFKGLGCKHKMELEERVENVYNWYLLKNNI